MIGSLPTTLNVGGEDRRIRSDFRTALLILEAYADPDLTDYDKCVVNASLRMKYRRNCTTMR